MSAITAKASRKMKKYAVLTREPRCFLGSFDFSWEQRKLGEMGQTYTGLSGKTKDDFGHGQARFVTYMNVFSNPISNPEMTEPIEIDPKQNEVEVGDVFFTTSSETPEEVGMSSILLEKRGKTYLNSFCFGFRPSEKIDSYYLAYMLRSESTRAKIILLAQGISRYNISKNKVMEIAVSLPSLDEQKMIGQYFSQLDNLITLHQRKCVFLFGFFQAFISMIFTASTFSWEQRKLSEMCGTFEYGLNAAAKEFDGKNKYIRITDIDDASREFLLSDLSSPDICLDGMSKYLLSSGDIVFARTGASVGKTYIYRENDGIVYFAGFLIRAKVNQDNDAEFVFQSTLSPSYEKYIRITSQRSGQPGVNAQEYGEYDLFAPSKEEQQRIGHFLRGIDNLITLHQRECISFTARAGRLILTANKKRNTSSWEQRKLGELGTITTGNTPSTSISDYYSDDGIVWVTPTDICENITFESARKLSDLGQQVGRVVPKNTILVTCIASIGKNTMLGNTGSFNQQINGLTPNENKYDPYFLLTESALWSAKMKGSAASGTMQIVNRTEFSELKTWLPSLIEQQAIGAFFKQLDNLITLHQRKPFLMKWRTSDANRNQTNRLVL